ncbi:MAG: autotransporter outer membrane beta-barrel domain-containing protein [Bacteroidales bacterium]|nr:autotransporter outer membrane beta-barrel domain-containing protein [Bacteroidales bacterium]
MMKRKSILMLTAFITLMSSTVICQDVQSTKVNSRDNNPSRRYLRPSLTIIYLNRGGTLADRMQVLFEKYSVPAKYNDHNVATRTIRVDDLKGNIQEGQLKDFLSRKVSREIVAKWFNRNDKGEFNMDLIADRGMYNATDADVIKAKASERKMALLQDAGENLLDRSYILVYDVKKILTADEYARLRGLPSEEEGYYALYDCYLFKLDWTDSVAAVFYNNLWNDSFSFDPARVEAFNKTAFPIVFVDKVSNAFGYVSSAQYKDHSRNILGSLSDDQLFARLFSKIVDEADTQLAQRNEDFKVKIPVFSTQPIQAKIGLKEGLSVDKRFFVYEFEINSKGEKKAVRKGVVRASNKIVDNRGIATGQTEPSKFYQVAGRKLYQGMLMQESPDWGLALTFGYGSTAGVVGEGLSVMLEANTSLYVGKVAHSYPPGIKIYVMGNLATSTFILDVNQNPNDPTNPEFSIYSYSGGISKDINFLRNFVLVPFVGYGVETYTNIADGMDKDKYESTFLEAGARLGMNLRYNIQLLATYSLNPIISTDFESKNEIPSLTKEQLDLFKDQRKSGQLTIGLRFQF